MNIKTVSQEIKYKITNKKYISITNFLIYDNFNKVFIKDIVYIPNKIVIIPVCIRQEFYSHMVLFIKQNDSLIYYDPSNKIKIKELEYYLYKKTDSKYIKHKINFINELNLSCTHKCLNFVKDFVSKIDS